MYTTSDAQSMARSACPALQAIKYSPYALKARLTSHKTHTASHHPHNVIIEQQHMQQKSPASPVLRVNSPFLRTLSPYNPSPAYQGQPHMTALKISP
jgi:hypothetical protein